MAGLLWFLVINLTSGSIDDTKKEATTANLETNTEGDNTEISTQEIYEVEEGASVVKESADAVKALSVSPGCIGCGKCARLDPEHFMMKGGLSEVISQENLDSSRLDSAINICPVDVITIS